MIIDVWRPKFSRIDGTKIVSHLEKVDDVNHFIKSKKMGWVVRYTCDTCGNRSTTRSGVLFNEETVYNTISKQTCRSCRTKISEYEIKKTYIPYQMLYDSIISVGYKLLMNEDIYNLLENKSQQDIPVICKNGHNYNITWSNWSKGKRCRICYEENKRNQAVKYKSGWDLYKFLVWSFTEKSYKEYGEKINPLNVERGSEYHLDHKFSISEGFKLGVLPKIIGSHHNLSVIESKNNLSKNNKCSITFDKLIDNYENFS